MCIRGLNIKRFPNVMSQKFSIIDVTNYNAVLPAKALKSYVDKYVGIISEFLLYIAEHVVMQDHAYYAFVIQRGLETLKHCFKHILLYTRNLELTIFNCKKALYYYVEFIGQIADDSHSYLQLNSKDATLFVYKKTIFDINNDHRKTFHMSDEERQLMEAISRVINCFHELIMVIIMREKITVEKKEAVIHFALKNSRKITEKLVKRRDQLSAHLRISKVMMVFIQMLQSYDLPVIDYCAICDAFVKKVTKKPMTILRLQERLHNPQCEKAMYQYTALRFTNWLFAD